jgi:hypothetical protein
MCADSKISKAQLHEVLCEKWDWFAKVAMCDGDIIHLELVICESYLTSQKTSCFRLGSGGDGHHKDDLVSRSVQVLRVWVYNPALQLPQSFCLHRAISSTLPVSRALKAYFLGPHGVLCGLWDYNERSTASMIAVLYAKP